LTSFREPFSSVTYPPVKFLPNETSAVTAEPPAPDRTDPPISGKHPIKYIDGYYPEVMD
jgi:hypothetical protein